MKEQPLSLGLIGAAIALAVLLWVGANVGMFLALYADTLTPLSLPYKENFEKLKRVDYRQFGGQWTLRDQTLVQSDTQNPDLFAVIPLGEALKQPYQLGVHIKVLKGPDGAGLLFNLQHKDNLQQSQLVRFGNSDGRKYLVFGYFDEKVQFKEQGSVAPPDISQGVDLAVVVHKKTYDVLVNGQPQQRDIPLKYSGGKVALTTWFSSVAFDNVFITPGDTAPIAVTTNDAPANAATGIMTGTRPVTTTSVTTPAVAAAPVAPALVVTTTQPVSPANNASQPAPAPNAANGLFAVKFADNVDQTQWKPLSGDWKFEPGALVQQQTSGYDLSISYAARTFTQFALRARFQHRQGVGGGVLFNLPNSALKNNGYMVRYFENNRLVWGYFDAKGSFVGQGDASVDPPGDQPHTLQIAADGTKYSITLDNKLIAENMPLLSKEGHIGLTASQSVVAFEEVGVTALAPGQQ
ncbi:MAG: hypothetical protein U0350_49945 [Caldilineaceae bacterium]